MSNSAIDEIIRRAMEEGQFDDLPGKGKPLRLDEDPNADSAWRMAYHALKSSGYSLPWIEMRQEIETDLEAARSGLRRTRGWRAKELERGADPGPAEAEWGRAQGNFREMAAELNKRIRSYNLEAPSARFQRGLIDAEREIERVMGE
jgi:DnaJ family protein C protein 28